MEFKLKDKGTNQLKFVIKDVNPAFVNALRRVSNNRIPVLAIEEVDFYDNSSPLFDEIVAQRLGQVPLDFDSSDYNFKEECDCDEGCPSCQAVFELSKEGEGTVYSGDIKFNSDNVDVLYEDIPITYLAEDQVIEVEGHAVLDTGEENSKHQASIPSYQYYPKIDIDNGNVDDADAIVELCPRDVFAVESGDLVVDDLEECSLCNECVEESDGIEVEARDDAFIFKIESVSGLNCKEILNKTIEMLEESADQVIDKLE